jgi:hypothetical protein
MVETTQSANGRVFISYSHRDKAFVQKLNDALNTAGVQAWVDWEGIELAFRMATRSQVFHSRRMGHSYLQFPAKS